MFTETENWHQKVMLKVYHLSKFVGAMQVILICFQPVFVIDVGINHENYEALIR